MPAKALSEKPPKVVLAIKLLYLVVGLGIIRTVMTALRHADVRSPYFLILSKLLVYTGSVFLLYQLGKGKNWAKWSLLIILAFSTPLTILPSLDSISHSPVHSLLGLLQLALYIAALAFLFQGSAARWFDAGKVSKTHRRP